MQQCFEFENMERLNLNIGDITSKIQQNFKGGYVGLKKLFELYFKSKKDKEELVFDEVDFEKFVNGQPIIILGYNVKHDLTKEIHFRKNNNKIQPYNFFNFYESNFKFEFLGQPVCSNSEILQELINGLEKIKSIFDEKDFITSCKNTLMFLETQIKISINCNEADNPKLFEKLIYMKNGYIETYNKVYDLYSHYITNFTKVDFREKTIDEMEFNINTKQMEVNYLNHYTNPNPLSVRWKESVYREMRKEKEDKLSTYDEVNEFLSEPIKKLKDCGFYQVLQNKYPEVEKQQSIIATVFRTHLNNTNIKYNIINVQTQYYNFCTKIGLIEHLEKTKLKSAVEIAKLLNTFSVNNNKDLKVFTVKSFQNNITNRDISNSSYFPFTDGCNKTVNTILLQLNLI
jgi:hypothetical protein